MQGFVADTKVSGFEHLADVDGSIRSRFGVVSQPSFAFAASDGTVETVVGSLGSDALRERASALIGSPETVLAAVDTTGYEAWAVLQRIERHKSTPRQGTDQQVADGASGDRAAGPRAGATTKVAGRRREGLLSASHSYW